MKKKISLLLAATIALGSINCVFAGESSAPAAYVDEATSGSSVSYKNNGAEFTFRLNDDNTLTITEMKCEEGADVVIPESVEGKTVTGMNWEAVYFGNLPAKSLRVPGTIQSFDLEWGIQSYYLESVVFEEGVKEIGRWSFVSNENLKSVSLPSTLTTIGEMAFNNCKSLEDVKIPSSVTSIGKDAFSDCTALKEITIPGGVETVDFLRGCTSLTSVTLGSGVKNIGGFYGCSVLKTIEIPEGAERLSESAFTNCTSLESVKLPSTLKTIEERCFEECKKLKTVEIPEGVEEIGKYTFFDCTALESVSLPSTLVKLGYVTEEGTGNGAYVFLCCNSLKDIKVAEGCKNYLVKNNAIYDSTGTRLIALAPGYEGAYKVAEGTRFVNEYAFTNCIKLTEVDLGETEEVGGNAFSESSSLKTINIGKALKTISAVCYTPALEKINVDPENSAYMSKDGVLFDKTGETLVCYPSGKEDKYYKVPEGTKTLKGFSIYYADNVRYLTLPESLETIETYAIFNFFNAPYYYMYVKFNGDNVNIQDEGCYRAYDMVYVCAENSTARKYAANKNGNCFTYENEFMYGDASGDKLITANDGAEILQCALSSSYAMGLKRKLYEEDGRSLEEPDIILDGYVDFSTDVNRDGIITAADSAEVLQKVLDSTYEMECEK